MKECWNLIPIKPNSKQPSVKWKKYITDIFPKDKLIEGNVAVICGEISDNLIIIDLDYKDNNKQYFKKIFSAFHKKYPKLAKTYIEETPNGHHFFYTMNGECPKRTTKQDTKKDTVLSTFSKQITTKFPQLLKGVDILGEGGYSLIAPSVIDGKEYKAMNNLPIREITPRLFDTIVDFFLLDKPIKKRMRKPFIDILNGDIEIEEQAIKTGMQEHVYWRYLYLEAWHFLGLNPEDLFPILIDKQPAFDLRKTTTQLNHVDFEDKPLTDKKLYEIYFPSYKKVRRRREPYNISNSDEDPIWLLIARQLKDKYDIITMSDSRQILIRDGNIYTLDKKEYSNKLARLVEQYTPRTYDTTKRSIESFIRDTTIFDRDDFCYEQWLINFKNGYYNTIENKFYPSDNFSDIIFCYEIPHEYNSGTYNCDKFKKLLEEWLENNSKITTDDIFEMMGYSMTMNTNLKKAFFIYGPTGTGKTTFQSILEFIVGSKNRSAISLQRMTKNEFGTDGLQFKILNMVGDMSSLRVIDISVFKDVVGGDRHIAGEVKGGGQYKFKPLCKIWYNANYIPEIENKSDDAFYSRWILIPFLHQFPMEDKETINNLADIICKDDGEIQGIIHECLKGVRRLYKRGYFRPEIVKHSKHIWRYQAEPLYAFINDFCSLREDGEIPSAEFRMRYNKYLYKVGKRPVSQHKLRDQLEKFNIFKDREKVGDRRYIYVGIKWKTEKPKNLNKVFH